MKTLLTLVLIYMLFSEVFQASAALKCYHCVKSRCDPEPMTCTYPADNCISAVANILGEKIQASGCVTKETCDLAKSMASCCQTDLCNGAEGVKLSLLIMLVPLISSILFL
ncbi:hypothetical protein NFI96_022662 [Prochilodus magdalenae]|nr:hypothetical protein NFI96_022662 [Prochilodus magdalenae]